MHGPAPLDRVAPTLRPPGRPAGHQRWRDLLFLHWEVPVAAVRPLVPADLQLDLTPDGRLYVGLVPFAMRDVRPAWSPRALAFDFLETNLRTYVHDGATPGVWFFSLEAASFIAVHAARLGWGLPYHHARMAHRFDGRVHHYGSVRRSDPSAGCEVAWEPGALLGPSAPGTLEHFLLERYVLFAQHRGRVLRGRVHHPPYPARRATLHAFTEGLFAAAGLPPAAGAPIVHASDGVDVDVFALEPL